MRQVESRQAGREAIREKTFQTGLWALNMSNRFGWSSKIQQQGQQIHLHQYEHRLAQEGNGAGAVAQQAARLADDEAE